MSNEVVRIYRGEDQSVTLGPYTKEAGGNPDSSAASATAALVDSIDSPGGSFPVEPFGSVTITDAATWTLRLDIPDTATSGLGASKTGTTYYWTVKVTAVDGTIKYLPVDDNGDPEHGTLVLYERAHA